MWVPPPSNWIKCNTDASRIKTAKLTTISYVCRDMGKILQLQRTIFGDCPVLVVEMLAIREAIKPAFQMKIDNSISESDSQVIFFILWAKWWFQMRCLY